MAGRCHNAGPQLWGQKEAVAVSLKARLCSVSFLDWRSRMQGLVARINSLASGVMNLNVCCAPEANRDGQLPHYVWTDGDSMLSKIPASGDADGSIQARKGDLKSAQPGALDNPNRSRVPLAGRYSGFLHRAADRGDETMLLAALKIDGNLLEGQDPSGNRALHLAARKGHIKICQILCQVLFAAPALPKTSRAAFAPPAHACRHNRAPAAACSNLPSGR